MPTSSDVRQLERGADLLRSQDAIDDLLRAWGADPRRATWSREHDPGVPADVVLRSLAEAMWASALPTIAHYRARPRQLRRMRRRWIEKLCLPSFPRWRHEAECFRDARPFTWESEKEMAARERRVHA
jgi:hypothetical protein